MVRTLLTAAREPGDALGEWKQRCSSWGKCPKGIGELGSGKEDQPPPCQNGALLHGTPSPQVPRVSYKSGGQGSNGPVLVPHVGPGPDCTDVSLPRRRSIHSFSPVTYDVKCGPLSLMVTVTRNLENTSL